MIHLKFSALKEAVGTNISFALCSGGWRLVWQVSSRISAARLGGLFLAFPAIFLASATLIEAHERRRKRETGLRGNRRGRQAAALDAAGATFGSAGLLHSPLWYGCQQRHYR